MIAPVTAKAVGVTAKVATVVLIQVPLATTVTLPAVALGVADMLTVVDVPVQPPGNVHVYDVAPATAETLYVFAVP